MENLINLNIFGETFLNWWGNCLHCTWLHAWL